MYFQIFTTTLINPSVQFLVFQETRSEIWYFFVDCIFLGDPLLGPVYQHSVGRLEHRFITSLKLKTDI